VCRSDFEVRLIETRHRENNIGGPCPLADKWGRQWRGFRRMRD